MASFMVRYFFSKDDYLEQTIEAHSLEDAEHSVYENLHPPHRVTAGDFPVFSFNSEGRVYLVPRDNVRYCEILTTEEAEPGPQHSGGAKR